MSDLSSQRPPGSLDPETEKRLAEGASERVLAALGPRLLRLEAELINAKMNAIPVSAPSWKTRIGTPLYRYRGFIAGSILAIGVCVLVGLNWRISASVMKELTWLIFSNDEILGLVTLWFSGLASWLILRILRWVGVKLKAEQNVALQDSVNKVMTLAVVRSQDAIRAKGWDHPSVKNEVIAKALPLLVTKFSDTLRDNGLDPTNPADQDRVRDMMERMLPDVFSRAAASPATPPAVVSATSGT